jgi:hypothetical protein
MNLLKYKEFLKESNLVYVNAQDMPAKDVLGTLDTSDPKYGQKVNSIKNTLAEEAFNHLKTIIANKLPPSARDAGARKVNDLARKYYSGGPENLGQLIDLIEENPLQMSSSSLYGSPSDPFSALASYYKALPTNFFLDLFKEQPGDMGPGELMFSVFTTFQKGTKGDLYDPLNKRNVEVKAKNGRLSGIGKMENGVDALDKINKILNSSIKSRGISKTTLESDIFPILKEKKLSDKEAEEFVLALSQIPGSFSTHKKEAVALVKNGIKSAGELSDLFLAIQLISYRDYAGFDDIMIFTDGNTQCQVIQISDASLGQIMGYGNIISYSGWATGQETAIGVSRRKR